MGQRGRGRGGVSACDACDWWDKDVACQRGDSSVFPTAVAQLDEGQGLFGERQIAVVHVALDV